LPITGWGTYTCRILGMPLTRATDFVTRSKTSVWTATVGTWYL
jgi:hypothetical protein